MCCAKPHTFNRLRLKPSFNSYLLPIDWVQSKWHGKQLQLQHFMGVYYLGCKYLNDIFVHLAAKAYGKDMHSNDSQRGHFAN